MAGRGGRRPGAGRKPKPKRQPAQVLQHPSVPAIEPAKPSEVFDPPAHLTDQERKVWNAQAAHAFAAGTLTRATAMAFERYCRLVAEEEIEAKSSAKGGSNHRGMLKQINTYELQFMLAPCGKAMPAWSLQQMPSTADEDDEFFGGANAGRR